MSTMTPVVTPKSAALTREASGQLRLTHPTRAYAVTRNPFAIWSILPGIALAFAALAMAITFINDATLATTAVGGFLVVTLGLLLIPAVSLKGSLSLTHDGITFERGKDHLTASWEQVQGIVNRRDAGLCLVIKDPQTTRQSWRLPGGFGVSGGEARIPLRFFGDRQFSILYDIRDRLPESAWRPALEQAQPRGTWRILAVYAGTVAVCGTALYAVMLVTTS
jgi:hypothetical protein